RARYVYATSHGFARGYATTTFGISVSPVAARNGEMQRDSWYSTARKRARVEDPVAVGRTAAARVVRRLGARKVKTVEVPVVFDPETAASLLRSIAGAASGPSLYRRASFLLDRLGTKVAAPARPRDAGGVDRVRPARAVRDGADRVRRQQRHGRLLARRGGAVDRERRARVSGRGNHRGRQPPRDVPGGRRGRRRSGAARTDRVADAHDRPHGGGGELG